MSMELRNSLHCILFTFVTFVIIFCWTCILYPKPNSLHAIASSSKVFPQYRPVSFSLEMDEININNLPAEILIEIFRYLNGPNLKNANMVCKLWNSLIESAFRWSLTLLYDEDGRLCSKNRHDAEQKMNFVLTTNRKFGKIKIIKTCLNDGDRMVEMFQRHGSNVVELRLCQYRIDNLTGFAELLNFTPNLKHATLNIDISHDACDMLLMDQLLPDLKKLKTLVIYGCCDYRITRCFRKAKLTTMAIRKYVYSDHRNVLMDFLSTQDKLTSLTVDSYSRSILVEMGKLNFAIPFRVTHLSIKFIDCEKPSQDYDNLMRFFESQAGSLTEIEMNDEISSAVYECVFANMTKLTTLWVHDKVPEDNDFYDQLKENCNVHTLRLDGGILNNFNIQFVGNFFQKLPNIRCLILMNPETPLNENILVAAQSLDKLESLHLGVVRETSLDCVKFPNLKTLHIQHLRGKINWNQFTKAHPLLAELTIERIQKSSYLTSDDIEQITTTVDLQQIRIGAVLWLTADSSKLLEQHVKS